MCGLKLEVLVSSVVITAVVVVVVGCATALVVGERLEAAPTPTLRQQKIQNGTVKISIQKIIPNIAPRTAPRMVPAEVDAVEY